MPETWHQRYSDVSEEGGGVGGGTERDQIAWNGQFNLLTMFPLSGEQINRLVSIWGKYYPLTIIRLVFSNVVFLLGLYTIIKRSIWGRFKLKNTTIIYHMPTSLVILFFCKCKNISIPLEWLEKLEWNFHEKYDLW